MDLASLPLLLALLQFAGPADDKSRLPEAPDLRQLLGQLMEPEQIRRLETERRLWFEPAKIATISVVGNKGMPRDYIVRLSGLKVGDDFCYPEIKLAEHYLLRSRFFVPDLEQTNVSVEFSARGADFRDVVIHVRETPATSQATKLAICTRILVYEWECVTRSARWMVEEKLNEWLGLDE